MRQGGFTIIEAMVALTILGIALGVFISILGNSLKMRQSLDEHAHDLFTARIIAEKFRLGLLEGDDEGETENGTIWTTEPIKIRMKKARPEGEEDGVFDENLEDEFGEEFEEFEEEEEDYSDLIFGLDEQSGKDEEKLEFYNIIVGGIGVSSSKKAKKDDFVF